MKEIKIATFYGDKAHIIEDAQRSGRLKFKYSSHEFIEMKDHRLYVCEISIVLDDTKEQPEDRIIVPKCGYWTSLENNCLN